MYRENSEITGNKDNGKMVDKDLKRREDKAKNGKQVEKYWMDDMSETSLVG